jgi:hypothetical protein
MPPAALLSLALLLVALQASLAVQRTVVVFRHTFRAPTATIKCMPGYSPPLTAWSNFSDRPLPDFDTTPSNATARGLQLTQEFAALLPQKLSDILTAASRVELVYDEVLRDQLTAEALAEGLAQAGITDVTLTPNSSLFDPVSAGVCTALPAANRTADCESQQTVVAQPSNYNAVMEAMQDILGVAQAPLLNSSAMDDYYSGGYWEGRTCVIASFAEVFLFEYGSRILVGWGDVILEFNSTAANALFRMLETHCYYRSVNMKGPVTSAHDHSNMANAMLRVLDGGDGSPGQAYDEEVVTIIVGHDADVDQVSTLFGLTFEVGGRVGVGRWVGGWVGRWVGAVVVLVARVMMLVLLLGAHAPSWHVHSVPSYGAAAAARPLALAAAGARQPKRRAAHVGAGADGGFRVAPRGKPIHRLAVGPAEPYGLGSGGRAGGAGLLRGDQR